ncbi:MAG: DUF2232 domain-containing protein [Tissierellia bacterium]|nr:DUF2232 domain-containing protein [Tissierellia bacterium]
MKLDSKNRALEMFFAISISTILVLMEVFYLPGISILYPVLFTVLGVRYGINYSLIGLIISNIVVGLIIDKVYGILVFLIFTPFCISLIYTIRKRQKSFNVLMVSSLVFLITSILLIAIIGEMAGTSVINQIENYFVQMLNSYVEVLKDTGISNYEILEIKDFLQDRLNYALSTLPSMVMIASLIIAYINYRLSALILRRLGHGIVSVPRFSRFKLPNNILLGIGIMLLGTYLLRNLGIFSYETVLLNIAVLASFMFFTQGLSVIDFQLLKRGLRKLTRVIIIVLFVVILPIGWIISLIGLLDVIIDFRKLKRST